MLKNLENEFIEIGKEILGASRNELFLAMRYLDVAIGELRYEYNDQIDFLGTNGDKLFYNSHYLMRNYKVNKNIINRDYIHILFHCIFKHLFETNYKDPIYWNLACDIAVEHIIDGFNYKQLEVPSSSKRDEIYKALRKDMKVLTAQKIYYWLIAQKFTEKEIDSISNEFFRDNHIYWYKNSEDSKENQTRQDDSHSNNLIEYSVINLNEKWTQIASKIKVDLETFSKQIGDEKGDLIRNLDILCRSKQDYRTFLKRFSIYKEEIQVDEDTFDYIFYTYGLSKYKNMPLIEPVEYKDVKKIEEFVIAIDTSASCSFLLIQRFLEETYEILKTNESFFRKINVHIIQCDTEIQEDYKITNEIELKQYITNYKVRGQGGTDFRPVFNYVNNLIQRKEFNNLKGLLYFTDGCGTYPYSKPSYDTAFVFIEDDYIDINVPPWAIKLIIEESDFIER